MFVCVVGGALAFAGFNNFSPAQAQTPKWQSLPGKSLDIGVGHGGAVCSIELSRRAWRLNGRKWVLYPGLGDLINIDAAPDSSVMAVRKDGTLHYHSGKLGAGWQQAGVGAMDVGIGGGWVWLTSTSGRMAAGKSGVPAIRRANGTGSVFREI